MCIYIYIYILFFFALAARAGPGTENNGGRRTAVWRAALKAGAVGGRGSAVWAPKSGQWGADWGREGGRAGEGG